MKKRPFLFAAAALAAIPFLAGCTGSDSAGEVLTGSLGASATLQTASGSDPNTGITVQGIGRVRVESDTALVNIGVEVEAASVTSARSRAATAAEAVAASVLDNGVAERDVQTVSFNISPRYDYRDDGGPVLTGYIVTNTISVTVRDLDRIGKVIDDAVDAGGDAVRINGIQFTVEDTVAAVRQARALAMAFALDTAEQLAAAAMVHVGAPLMITESSSSARPPIFDGDAGAGGEAPGTPVFTGTQTVEVVVTVRYAIE